MTRKLVTLIVALTMSAVAQAQDYPSRPIRIIQGFPPGGNADSVARVLAQELQKGLGQPVVVEAKPGAGGTVGADVVAKAPADGYTLALLTGGHAVAGALYKSLPYKTVDDFEWISTATEFPFVVSARSEAKASSLAELMRLAKENPGKVTYGSAGVGATQHLTAELLGAVAGVKFLHVPYRGEAASLTATLGGEVDFNVTTATVARSQVEGGKLRALAVTSKSRWRGLPQVPTAEEAGLKGFDVSSWAGIAAPRGTPKPIIDRLSAEMQRTLKVAEVRARLEAFGGEVRGSTPAEMRVRVAGEVERWAKVIRDSRIEKQ